jgi:hypothetical protein
MVQSDKCRQRVVESLIAADVPEALAVGIADVLVEAGFERLSASPPQSERAAMALVSSRDIDITASLSFLRFPPITKTLPTLLLKHDQRIDGVAAKRQLNMYRYTRMAAQNRPNKVLVLTPKDRVA